MQQWQVGPVPEYNMYSNTTGHPNEIHPGHYQTDMSRRQEHYPYGAPPPQQPGQQQHHPTPVQPSMAHAQPPQASHQQPQTPTPAPASAPRRKRPAPQPSHQPSHAPQHPTGPPQAQSQSVPAAGPPSSATQTPGQQPGAPTSASATGSAAPVPTDDVNSTPSQPPAKKSRTNTPWTPAEELRLKQMRDAGNSWAEIAKTFPTRTEGSVKKHWYKDMHYAEFAEDESQALLNAIKEYENNKWKVIGQKVGKPAKACEQYAKEHFPDLFGTPKAR